MSPRDLQRSDLMSLTLDGRTPTITFETAQHLGDSIVPAISRNETDGLVRGQAVVDTGARFPSPSVTA